MGGQGLLVLVQMSDPESTSELAGLEGEGGAVQMCQPQMCPGLSAAVAETLDKKRKPRSTELLSANLTECYASPRCWALCAVAQCASIPLVKHLCPGCSAGIREYCVHVILV